MDSEQALIGAGADVDTCDSHSVNEQAVRRAMAARSSETDIAYLADTFQLLASPSRLRIVEALAGREMCVCDLASVVGVSQSAVSHHLRQMRQLRIVRWRKEGRLAFYRLDDEHVEQLFRVGMEHVGE